MMNDMFKSYLPQNTERSCSTQVNRCQNSNACLRTLPATYEVDYIRVFQTQDGCAARMASWFATKIWWNTSTFRKRLCGWSLFTYYTWSCYWRLNILFWSWFLNFRFFSPKKKPKTSGFFFEEVQKFPARSSRKKIVQVAHLRWHPQKVGLTANDLVMCCPTLMHRFSRGPNSDFCW